MSEVPLYSRNRRVAPAPIDPCTLGERGRARKRERQRERLSERENERERTLGERERDRERTHRRAGPQGRQYRRTSGCPYSRVAAAACHSEHRVTSLARVSEVTTLTQSQL